ncbi:hypothetical protein ONZ51_g377 [Trametes cubensis]|uniref:GAG-pre-integrase domain-containing protein n=1 Tax=Trametes cubensis TaxID=1111947 RepID=A0AAD7U3H8_9APHY|nr:hypothetical protein ONZ51_g377 [Trametes cubensis]
MTDNSSSSYRIEPLNGNNYHTWIIQMANILTKLELWEYVTGTCTLLADPAQQPVWHKKDVKALCAIRLCVAKDVLVYAQDVKTSKVAWDTLAETFQENSLIGIIQVPRKLFRAQCPEGGDIEEHLHKLCSYRSELHALGQTVTDADFAMIILTSLPNSWDPFICAIDPSDVISSNGQSSHLTSAKLITRIHQEDRCTKRDEAPETALKTVDKSTSTCHKLCPGQRSGSEHCPHCDHDSSHSHLTNSRPRTHNDDSCAYVANEETSESDGDTPARQVMGTIWLTEDAPNISDTALAVNQLNIIHTLACSDCGGPTWLTLTNVAHVPSATHNLVSVVRLTEAGANVAGRLYHLHVTTNYDTALSVQNGRTWDDWHHTFAHLNYDYLRDMAQKQLIIGMEVDKSVPASEQCHTCIKAKQHREPFLCYAFERDS